MFLAYLYLCTYINRNLRAVIYIFFLNALVTYLLLKFTKLFKGVVIHLYYRIMWDLNH